MNWERLLDPDNLVMLVPITAILVGGAIAITRLVIRHRERIAMIEHGMHPDAPPSRTPARQIEDPRLPPNGGYHEP